MFSPVISYAAGSVGDTDGDSVPDIADLDDDNDTIPDDVEGFSDLDGDGIANCFDLDSDNDGIPDLFEAVANINLVRALDADGNGVIDAGIAVGENGLADRVEPTPESGTTISGIIDTDSDGIPDFHDLDVDNDGVPDVIEAGSSDSNRDGRYDFFLDLNSDGLADRLSAAPIVARDTDQDSVVDFRDSDSDGDGLSDRLETAGVDTDNDGRVDDFVDLNVDGLNDAYVNGPAGLPDSDQDGFPDYRDLDSDGDGVSDADEAFDTLQPTELVTPATPFNPRPNPTVQAEALTLETGENGSVFGCSVSGTKNDPVLPVMLLLALAGLLRRARVAHADQSARLWKLAVVLVPIAALSACAIQPRNAPLTNRSAEVRPYAGVGLGASFLNANTSNLPITQDQSYSAAGQITVGTSIGRYFALEARAADLGEATFTDGRAVGYQVADVSALYTQRFGKLTGFGRIGAGALFNDGDLRTTQRNPTHLVVGAGLDFALTSRVGLRAEWQGHDVDVMHGQMSVLYRFGAPRQARPIVVATTDTETANREQNVAIVQEPEPVAQVTPAPRPEITRPTIESPASNSAPATVNEPVAAAVPAAPESVPALPNRPSRPVAVPEPVNAPVAVPEPAVVASAPINVPAPVSEVEAAAGDSAQSGLAIEPLPDNTIALATPAAGSQPSASVDAAAESAEKAPSGRLKPLINVPVPKKITPPPTDSDNDGIVDASDKCPGTSTGTAVLADGCPLFGKSVPGLSFFPLTDRLTEDAKVVLDTVADALSDESDIRVTVAAHTAPAEDADAAMFLSRRRTIAIIRYLSDKGIDAARLRPEAFGDTQPLAGAAEPSENERVVLTPR